jgi:hypothetical protein
MIAFDDDDATQIKEITFNPQRFLESIKTKFNDYINQLGDESNTELRSSFDRVFQQFFELEELNNPPATNRNDITGIPTIRV